MRPQRQPRTKKAPYQRMKATASSQRLACRICAQIAARSMSRRRATNQRMAMAIPKEIERLRAQHPPPQRRLNVRRGGVGLALLASAKRGTFRRRQESRRCAVARGSRCLCQHHVLFRRDQRRFPIPVEYRCAARAAALPGATPGAAVANRESEAARARARRRDGAAAARCARRPAAPHRICRGRARTLR